MRLTNETRARSQTPPSAVEDDIVKYATDDAPAVATPSSCVLLASAISAAHYRPVAPLALLPRCRRRDLCAIPGAPLAGSISSDEASINAIPRVSRFTSATAMITAYQLAGRHAEAVAQPSWLAGARQITWRSYPARQTRRAQAFKTDETYCLRAPLAVGRFVMAGR